MPTLLEYKTLMSMDEKQFDVALSFAGEDRKYVEEAASNLREMGIKVFYDKYELVTLWGKNLYDHFPILVPKLCLGTLFWPS